MSACSENTFKLLMNQEEKTHEQSRMVFISAILHLHRVTPEPLVLLDLLARRDPKETVERLDLLVALVRWVPLDPQVPLERRVAPVLMVLP